MTTPVFAHGAFHSSWHWHIVRENLRAAGIESVAMDLPMTTLDEDAEELRRSIDSAEDDVVVIGHSWGGSVITLGASGHPRVRHLVYLAALMLDAGIPAPSTRRETIGGRAAVSSGDKLVVDPTMAKDRYYNEVDDALANEAVAMLRPFSRSSFDTVETTIPPAWRDIASTYVVCTHDNSIHPDDQREMAKKAGIVVEWESDHAPFLSHPELVVELILNRVRGSH